MQRSLSPRHQVLHSLYSEHRHWLQRWLRKKLGCNHQAADLTQDTFMRLLLLPDVAELEAPRAYLTTTATRLMIDHVRRRKIEQAYLQATASIHADAYANSPEQCQEAIEALDAVVQLLEGLSDKARRAFLLSRLEGLPHAEIALQLGVSKSSVKQYIAGAMMHCYAVVHGEAGTKALAGSR